MVTAEILWEKNHGPKNYFQLFKKIDKFANGQMYGGLKFLWTNLWGFEFFFEYSWGFEKYFEEFMRVRTFFEAIYGGLKILWLFRKIHPVWKKTNPLALFENLTFAILVQKMKT